MPRRLQFLIAEDNSDDAQLLLSALRQEGFDFDHQIVASENEYLAHLRPDLDIILADYAIPRFGAMKALELLQERGLEIPFIIVSGAIGEDQAVAAMKLGAADYLLKDRLGRLGPAVEQALEQARLRQQRRQAEEELRSTHTLLRQLLEHSPAVIYALKVEGQTVAPQLVSDYVTALLGFSVPEAMHYDWWVGQLHPEDRDRAVASISETLTDGASLTEYRLRHKDGTFRWVEDKRRLIRDARGQPVELVGISTDISERKHAEEFLRHASRQNAGRQKAGMRKELAVILAVSAAVFGYLFFADPFQAPIKALILKYLDWIDDVFEVQTLVLVGLIVFLYRRWRGFLNQASQQLQIQEALQTLHGELDKRVQQRTAELARMNEALRTEIAGHQQTEDARRESEERFRQVVQNIEEVFWMVSVPTGEMLFVSAAYEKIWGRTCQSLYAEPKAWLDAVHPEDRDRVLRAAQTKQVAGTYREEYRIIRPDGEIRWISDRAFPVYDAQGVVYRVAGVAEDITQHRQAREELQLFRNLVDQSTDTFEIIDPETARFLDVSARGPADLGCTRDEYLALRVFDIDPGMTPSIWAGAVERMRSSGSIQRESSHRRMDGTLYPIEVSAKLVRLEREYVVATIRDITVRKQAEEHLHEREAMLANAQRIGRMGSWSLDLRSGRLTWSDATCDLFGIAPGEFDGTFDHFWSFVLPEDRPPCDAEHTRISPAHPTLDAEYRIRRPDGEVRWMYERGNIEFDAAGNQVRRSGMVMDITERKRAEHRVQELAAMLDLAHDAIFVRRFSDQVISFWNKGAERLYGWTSQEAIGRNVVDLNLVTPEKLQSIQSALLQTDGWRGEIKQAAKDGRSITVSTRATLVRDARGEPELVLVINTDTTGQKELEARFLRAQRMESIGTLASGVAHDLNNILAPILMSATLLRRQLSPEAHRDIVETIELSASRGAQVVKQVLTFGRGVDGERRPMQVASVIKELVKMMSETFPKDIVVQSSLPHDLWLVVGDATQLHQVLLNLFVNARDAMPHGGELRVFASNCELDETHAGMLPGATPGPNVLLEIRDRGTGIPPEIREQIFDPFFTTKEPGMGTGLGPSTVLGIVKSHGGHVGVISEPGEGTTFQIHLPAVRDAAADVADATLDAPPLGHGECVLVVDDEERVRKSVRMVLEAHGYTALLASDGIDALAVFAKHHGTIAVVLTDLMMPHMDGVAFIRAVRRIAPRVPIVASTGLGTKKQLAELKQTNINALLTKPYGVESLLCTIRDVLSGTPSDSPV